MEFVISRDAALEAVSFTRAAVSRRSTIPILGSILLDATKGGVGFRATDLDMEAATRAEAEVAAPAAHALDAERLYGALQTLPAGVDVSVALDVNSQRVSLRCGRAKFQIPALAGSDFPQFVSDKPAAEFEIPGGELARLIQATEYAVSRDQARPYITGVRFHFHEGSLRAVATNGAVMSVAETPLPRAAEAPALTLPLKATAQVLELANSAEVVFLSLSERLFRAAAGDKAIVSRVIEQDFPHYLRVIPENPHVCEVDRAALLSGLRRALVVTEGRAPAVRLSIAKTTMSFLARGEHGEVSEDEIGCSADAEMAAPFNAKYLLEIASRFSGETLHLHYADAVTPVAIRDPSEPDRLVVIIALRTD